MLPKPAIVSQAVQPVAALCDAVMITTRELAAHWRQSADYLANVRKRQGVGPAFIRLPHGAIRYRLSDVLRHELCGQQGVTPEAIRLAVHSCPEIPPLAREPIAQRISALCFGNHG